MKPCLYWGETAKNNGKTAIGRFQFLMKIEFLIIILMWVIGLISYILFTPKNRYRRLLFAFLVCKTLMWISIIIHAKFHLISFPVRELPNATKVLITTGYFFYPLICGFYVIFEPKRSLALRFLYLSMYITGLTIFEVILEKYTNLITYIHYAWYWTWINLFCTFAVSNIIYWWFFRDKNLFQQDKEIVR
jgi:hypothetical protein